jgi:lipopolysaccharide biosynthesis regulator YciM
MPQLLVCFHNSKNFVIAIGDLQGATVMRALRILQAQLDSIRVALAAIANCYQQQQNMATTLQWLREEID